MSMKENSSLLVLNCREQWASLLVWLCLLSQLGGAAAWQLFLAPCSAKCVAQLVSPRTRLEQGWFEARVPTVSGYSLGSALAAETGSTRALVQTQASQKSYSWTGRTPVCPRPNKGGSTHLSLSEHFISSSGFYPRKFLRCIMFRFKTLLSKDPLFSWDFQQRRADKYSSAGRASSDSSAGLARSVLISVVLMLYASMHYAAIHLNWQ